MLQHNAGACTAFSLDSVHACSSGKSFDYRVRVAGLCSAMQPMWAEPPVLARPPGQSDLLKWAVNIITWL